MLSFFERLDKFMVFKGLNDNKITLEAGIANGIIGKGRKRGALSQDNISKILYSYPELDANWLFTGTGKMLKEQKEAATPVVLHEKQDIKEYARPITPHITASEPAQNYISENVISIPIVDVSAAAGYGRFNSDHPEKLGEMTFPANFLRKKYGNYYCGKVDGESMEPTLLYGDFIVFRLLSPAEWGEVKDGDIYFIVERSGATFVKRIKNQLKKDGSIICRSDNQNIQHREFPIYNDDIANIYHVEWRFSNDMTNVNQMYFNRLKTLEDRFDNLENLINTNNPKLNK